MLFQKELKHYTTVHNTQKFEIPIEYNCGLTNPIIISKILNVWSETFKFTRPPPYVG